jgi:hypothetical protein
LVLKMEKVQEEIYFHGEKFHYLYTSPNVTKRCSQIQEEMRGYVTGTGRCKIYIQNFSRNI